MSDTTSWACLCSACGQPLGQSYYLVGGKYYHGYCVPKAMEVTGYEYRLADLERRVAELEAAKETP